MTLSYLMAGTLQMDALFRRRGKPGAYHTRDRLLDEHRVLILGQHVAKACRPPVPDAYCLRIMDHFTPLDPLEHPEAFTKVFEARMFDHHHAEDVEHEVEGIAAVLDAFAEIPADYGVFIIHCKGGISRSAAAAIAFLRSRGDTRGAALVEACDLYDHNDLILAVLEREIERRAS